MIFNENRLPADDSHEISCLICYFWKKQQNLKLLSAANYRWWKYKIIKKSIKSLMSVEQLWSNFMYCSDFLAHLSRRLMGELIVYQSLGRPSVNIFKHLLWNHWACNQTQISYGNSLGVCTNGPGHMTKMAPTPIYSNKNPLKIFSRLRRRMTLRLGM